MIFVTHKELDAYIRSLPKSQITDSDDTKWDIYELTAIDRVYMSLGSMDYSCVFPEILTAATSSTYLPGDYVYNDDTSYIYQVQATCSGTFSYTDTDYFEIDEPRKHLIIDLVVHIMTYKGFGRVSTSQIPEQVSIDYEDAMMVLDRFSEGQTSFLNDCLRDDDGDGIPDGIGYGSNTKIDQYY